MPAPKSKPERRAAKRRRRVASTHTGPAPRAFTLYCDEAGNTGFDYLNPDQPVHVIAGWLVPQNREQAWLDAIAALQEERGGNELKESSF